MESFEQMIRNPDINCSYELFDIPNQIKYSKQHKLKVGTELFEQNGKLVGVDFYPRSISEIVKISKDKICIETELPEYIFTIVYISYKSAFHKWFRRILKYPIRDVLVDVNKS